MSNPTLTHERLKELLDYEPATGVFINRVTRNSSAPVGKQAGCVQSDGYIHIRVHKRLYYAARLAWFYVHGRWPSEQIDHINLDKLDNRISNLREATKAQNTANTSARRNNKCGKKGVFLNRNRWRAQINKSGRQINLGTFSSAEEAHAAYAAAARIHFGEFARAE